MSEEKHEYKVGNMTIESNVSKEEAEEMAKTSMRETAKDAAVKAVKMTQSLEKAVTETANSAVESAKKAIEEAKPMMEKAKKDVEAFIDEVKEEVKKQAEQEAAEKEAAEKEAAEKEAEEKEVADQETEQKA